MTRTCRPLHLCPDDTALGSFEGPVDVMVYEPADFLDPVNVDTLLGARMVGWKPDLEDYQPDDSQDDDTPLAARGRPANVVVTLGYDGHHYPQFDLDGRDPFDTIAAALAHLRLGQRSLKHLLPGTIVQRPVRDSDLWCVTPSTNHALGHLWLQHPMPWAVYADLLVVLADANHVDPLWTGHALRRGFGTLRAPGYRKTSTTR